MGASVNYDNKPGTCIRALTGGGRLQGRISSKAYAILFLVKTPISIKRAHYMVIFDIKEMVKHKVRLFSNVYNKYFERTIWSKDGKANKYLAVLGEAVLKLLDIVANTIKPYCYNPPHEHKQNLKIGTTGIYRDDDKLEIAPHYEDSKRNAKAGYSFCTECSESTCKLNKAMCVIFASVAEFIEVLKNLEDGKKIKLSMLDFFTEDEINHFLIKFTTQGHPVSNYDRPLEWLNNEIIWPRRITTDIDLREAAIRYDVVEKDIYRQDVWDGLYTREIFEKIDASIDRFPPNFDDLLNSAFGVNDESVFTIRLDSNESINPDFTNGENVSELPFDDGRPIDPKWEKWAERKFRDPSWRRDAKEFYTRLIRTTKEYNELNEGKYKRSYLETYIILLFLFF